MSIDELYAAFLSSNGVVTDSRKSVEGKIFFGIKGPNFDGNAYAIAALEKGASLAVVDDINIAKYQDKVVLVSDSLKTLQELASLHKKSLGIPVIGITGTNGKTTSKELLSAVLNSKHKCYATKGNLNNHLGVPLSLLEMNKDHNIAIIEMGANRMGDIKELCEIADPDYGYITNIGVAHLEGFGSKDNIKREKGELFEYVKRKSCPFFANQSEGEVMDITGDYKHKVTIGEKVNADYVFHLIQSSPYIIASHNGKEIISNLYGIHNYQNIKMAAGIGLHLGVPMEGIVDSIKAYHANNNRSEILKDGDSYIFLDAYNANPSSMESSIRSFIEHDSKKKVLILGDMLEMGASSLQHHSSILKLVSKYNWQKVILVGEQFETLKSKFSTYHFFADVHAVNDFLKVEKLKDVDYLIKGSRGIALENLDFIKQLK